MIDDELKKSMIKSLAPALDSIAEASKSMCEDILSNIDFQLNEITKNILSQISANALKGIKQIVKLLPSFEELEYGAKSWGDYGWCSIGYLSIGVVRSCPNNRIEADKMARSCLPNHQIDNIVKNISARIRKEEKEDLKLLFQNKQYTMVAMLLTAIIDRELICIPNKFVRNARSKQSVNKLVENMCDEDMAKLMTLGLANVYNYFFKSGDNFNRKLEGELNRNFLHHGFMYRSVKKTTCIKLLIMLDSIQFIKENYDMSKIKFY